jgi:hypothetical protein
MATSFNVDVSVDEENPIGKVLGTRKFAVLIIKSASKANVPPLPTLNEDNPVILPPVIVGAVASTASPVPVTDFSPTTPALS